MLITTVACVSSRPLVLSERYGTPATTAQRPDRNVNAAPCFASIDSIADSRSDRATFGTVAGRRVHPPENVAAWLQNTLEALGNHGITIKSAAVKFPGTIAIHAELLTAWVSDLRSSRTANIVLRVTYGENGSPILYRGTANGINWSSGDSELQHMIDKALTEIVDTMSRDIVKLCKAS